MSDVTMKMNRMQPALAVLLVTVLAAPGCSQGGSDESQPRSATVADGATAGAASDATPAKPGPGVAAGTAAKGAAPAASEASDEDAFYSIGQVLGGQLLLYNPTPEELEIIKAGAIDAALGRKPKVARAEVQGELRKLLATRRAEAAAEQKKLGAAFVAKAATETSATQTASGLVIQEIKAGTGVSPTATDRVKVHYHGTLIDGTVFDSSVDRGTPVTFPLSGVIKCWTEGLQLMKVGGKSRLICPSDIAYGDNGRPPTIKPGATLVFDVELLEIVGP